MRKTYGDSRSMTWRQAVGKKWPSWPTLMSGQPVSTRTIAAKKHKNSQRAGWKRSLLPLGRLQLAGPHCATRIRFLSPTQDRATSGLPIFCLLSQAVRSCLRVGGIFWAWWPRVRMEATSPLKRRTLAGTWCCFLNIAGPIL